MTEPATTTLLIAYTLLAAFAAGLFVLQQIFPLRRRTTSLGGRLVVNVVLTAVAFATAALTVAPVSTAMLGLVHERGIGILALVSLPAGIEVLAAFLLMDFTFYWWHRANHRIRLLWRFHNVHHIDPDLDVTTSFRFHAGEMALSAGFRVIQISLIGMSALTFFLYQLVFNASTIFHHSNLKLPIRVERALNALIVTPRMHGVHHSTVREETNSNYSVVLRWWDMLWRTLHVNVPQSAVKIGVPAYHRPRDNRIWPAIIMPFTDQRDYWRTDNGDVPHRTPGEFPESNRLAQ